MTKQIYDKIVEKMELIEYFDIAYDDGKTTDPKEFEDDNCIHIARGKYRFCFYNGQDESALTEKDVKRYGKEVDKVLKEIKAQKTTKPKASGLNSSFIQDLKNRDKKDKQSEKRANKLVKESRKLCKQS